jgi:hypothetical protein
LELVLSCSPIPNDAGGDIAVPLEDGGIATHNAQLTMDGYMAGAVVYSFFGV